MTRTNSGVHPWLSLSPALLVVDSFLSSEECDALVALAATDLRRSRVTDGHVSTGRTSSSTFLTGDKAAHPLVLTIEKRILEFVKAAQQSLNELQHTPDESCEFTSAEPVQCVKYTVGQCYTSHFDNRAVRGALSNALTFADCPCQGSVARVATFMVYCASPISCVHPHSNLHSPLTPFAAVALPTSPEPAGRAREATASRSPP